MTKTQLNIHAKQQEILINLNNSWLKKDKSWFVWKYLSLDKIMTNLVPLLKEYKVTLNFNVESLKDINWNIILNNNWETIEVFKAYFKNLEAPFDEIVIENQLKYFYWNKKDNQKTESIQEYCKMISYFKIYSIQNLFPIFITDENSSE